MYIFGEIDKNCDGVLSKKEMLSFVKYLALQQDSSQARIDVLTESKIHKMRCGPEGIGLQQFCDFYVN
jgi:Ca2+-binding EF-hand superfamily protein